MKGKSLNFEEMNKMKSVESTIDDVVQGLNIHFNHRNFGSIHEIISTVAPSFWITNPSMDLLMIKIAYLEGLKCERGENFDILQNEKMRSHLDSLPNILKDSKVKIFNYLKSAEKDLFSSILFENKVKFYFNIILERLRLNLRFATFLIDFENFQHCSRDLESKYNSIEDIEDSLYLNDIFVKESNLLKIQVTGQNQNPYDCLEVSMINSLVFPGTKNTSTANYRTLSSIKTPLKTLKSIRRIKSIRSDQLMDLDCESDQEGNAKDIKAKWLKRVIIKSDNDAESIKQEDFDSINLNFGTNFSKKPSGEVNPKGFYMKKASGETKYSCESDFLGKLDGKRVTFFNPETRAPLLKSDLKSLFKSEKKQVFVIKKVSKERKILEILKGKLNIPFLRKFNPKIIKREEIDKKIIRKFRKFMKNKIRSRKFNEYHPNFQFWLKFTKENMMPPYTFFFEGEELEFKSFNWNYITWLISRQGANDLFASFFKEKKTDISNWLKKKVRKDLSEVENKEFKQITEYIEKYCSIYDVNKIEKLCVEQKVTQVLEISKNQPIKTISSAATTYRTESTSSQLDKDISVHHDKECCDLDGNIKDNCFNIDFNIDLKKHDFFKSNYLRSDSLRTTRTFGFKRSNSNLSTISRNPYENNLFQYSCDTPESKRLNQAFKIESESITNSSAFNTVNNFCENNRRNVSFACNGNQNPSLFN